MKKINVSMREFEKHCEELSKITQLLKDKINEISSLYPENSTMFCIMEEKHGEYDEDKLFYINGISKISAQICYDSERFNIEE